MNKKNKGFTLIELMIVIAIIGILSLIGIINYRNISENSKLKGDMATIRILNDMTQIYRSTSTTFDPFLDPKNQSSELLTILVNSNYLNEIPVPQSLKTSFSWHIQNEKWYLVSLNHEISTLDGVFMDTSSEWFKYTLKGSFSGIEKDIIIPEMLDNKAIYMIYQEVFQNKSLLSVSFSDKSQITHIHARAFKDNLLKEILFPKTLKEIHVRSFMNNKLTEITLPNSVSLIEEAAFKGNNITKITVGDNLTTIYENAFDNNTKSFKSAYDKNGAGTYIFENGIWTKQ